LWRPKYVAAPQNAEAMKKAVARSRNIGAYVAIMAARGGGLGLVSARCLSFPVGLASARVYRAEKSRFF
jgi:hypothetical protein